MVNFLYSNTFDLLWWIVVTVLATTIYINKF